MAQAEKVLAFVSRSVVSVSTKLSVVAVMGLAALPLLPQDAASRLGGPLPRAADPVEVAETKPVPLGEAAPVEPTFQLVARRRVERRAEPEDAPPKNSAISRAPEKVDRGSEPDTQPKPGRAEPDRENRGEARRDSKMSAISAPEAPKAPVAASGPKPETQAEPPKPQTWSEPEMIAALRECVRLLAPIASEVEIAPPMRHEQCGTPAPVLVKRIGSGAGKVEVSPPAVLNCAMVAGLHTWIEKTLQPAAREVLGVPVIRLRNASGYVCRARNGHPLGTDKLSEHALANAVDIAGFVTADGRTIDVARFWGPTERDRREAERVAAARAKAEKAAKDAKPARADPPEKAEPAPQAVRGLPTTRKMSLISHKPEASPKAKAQDANALRRTAALERSGKGASDAVGDPKAVPAPSKEGADVSRSAEAAFLRKLHKGACGVFGTVLGPDANELHRDHFHLDLASRRHSAFCQ